MKSFVVLALLSTTTFAQIRGDGPGNLVADGDGLSFQVAGRGKHVCSAQSMSSRPVLARGESKKEAQVLALQECARQQGGNGFHCKVEACEKDTVNGSLVEVIFDISRTESNATINFKGKVKYLCTAESFRNVFMAKAPTKVEAQVLVTNLCADASNGNAFHCDPDSCEIVSGAAGSIDIGNIIDKVKPKLPIEF